MSDPIVFAVNDFPAIAAVLREREAQQVRTVSLDELHGSALDGAAHHHNLSRKIMESDAELRSRIQDAINAKLYGGVPV